MRWGGASGSVINYNGYSGTAGTASSFGNYVSAPGAAAPNSSGQGSVRQGGRAGVQCTDSMFHSYIGLGPCGAPGWLPGIGYVDYPVPIFELVSSGGSAMLGTHRWQGSCGPQVELNNSSSKQTLCNKSAACGGAGTADASDKRYHGPAPGGLGFGAGGGGGVAPQACGGNSGGLSEATVKLTTLSSIAVTVGVGGVSSVRGTSCAGDGADGCVAVFW